MKVDMQEDVQLVSFDHFGIDIKNSKIHFRVNNDKHVFGSKMFPVGKRANIFIPVESDEKGDYKEVADSLERGGWKHRDGFCYTNAETLHQTFLIHGIDAKYYSGWVFTAPMYPVHHAWVVVDDSIYDIGIHEKAQEKLIEQISKGIDNYSAEAMKEVKAVRDIIYPLQDNFAWGKSSNVIYVGSENTPTGARKQYNDCMDKFPSHPSYPNRPKGEKHYRSKYQSLMDDM